MFVTKYKLFQQGAGATKDGKGGLNPSYVFLQLYHCHPLVQSQEVPLKVPDTDVSLCNYLVGYYCQVNHFKTFLYVYTTICLVTPTKSITSTHVCMSMQPFGWLLLSSHGEL